MLKSIEIKNYRILKNLKIPSLKRVNLITGKNNTGKSSLLEAVQIYAAESNLNLIFQLLKERGENYIMSRSKDPIDAHVKTFSTLFTNRVVGFQAIDRITIGEVNSESYSFIGFIKYTDEVLGSTTLNQRLINNRKVTILNESQLKDFHFNVRVGLEFGFGITSKMIPLDAYSNIQGAYTDVDIPTNVKLIGTQNTVRENGELWDSIVLTEKEAFVIEALRVINPDIERIAYIEDSIKDKRTTVIKLKNEPAILPLSSMGDGINRILNIILNLVNADNGYLLVDEIENGLHYSIQEQLWRIIFKLSKSLDVQIFATTHSEDCIRSFQTALNEEEETSQGKLIRLDNRNGIIKPTEYDARELKIASYNDIETR